MTDDWLLSLLYAAWLTASTMPLGFMLGSSCSPCCGCGVADGKPRTDPKNEGTWVPSGTWATSVTWTFTANPGDESGETWFFYGSSSTSKVGGGATQAQQLDWGNICNWYSDKATSPSVTSGLPGALNKRATRLPPEDAVVHIYTPVSTVLFGPATVKTAYIWSTADFLAGSELTTTSPAHDSTLGAFFNGSENLGTVSGGATFFGISAANDGTGVVNDGALFKGSENSGTVNDGAEFEGADNLAAGIVNGGGLFKGSLNLGIVNDSGTFQDGSDNAGTVNGGGTFQDTSINQGTVNNGATFNNNAINFFVVNGGAEFNDFARNRGAVAFVNGGATFNDSTANVFTAVVNDGATFNNTSFNETTGTVNGGATFNDAACSQRAVGNFFAVPCTRKFVTHPTDLPTCNGTAPDGCTGGATCGCG